MAQIPIAINDAEWLNTLLSSWKFPSIWTVWSSNQLTWFANENRFKNYLISMGNMRILIYPPPTISKRVF